MRRWANRAGGVTPPSAGVLFSSLGLTASDPFIVAAGVTILMDENTPALGATSISGTVRPVDLTTAYTFTTTGITVEDGGLLEYGTADEPVDGPAIVLNGAYSPLVNTTIASFTTPTTSDASNRGIMVMPGGTCDLHGTSPTTIWTTLNAHGSGSSLTLATSPAWASGDPIVVAPTDFHGYQAPELFTLNGGTSGTTATLSSPLAAARWGLLQYPTDAGLSLTAGTFSTKKASIDVPTVLDERARVVNLKRGLSISAPLDSDWTNKGHGLAIMVMASSGANKGVLRMSGVQLRRAGQRGALGRYPIHWHMMSYTTGGSFTSNVTEGYARKCVVWDSENRAYTIHGTRGVELSDNVSYNAKGHAYFLEDGSERDNSLLRNLSITTGNPSAGTSLSISSISGNGSLVTVVFGSAHGMYTGQTLDITSSSVSGYNKYRTPVTVTNSTTVTYAGTGSGAQSGATATKGNDRIKIHDGVSSGFWITNMANTFADNYACYSDGNGVWQAMSSVCFGLSASVAINPSAVDPLSTTSFAGFTCHSNFGWGLQARGEVADEAGNISANIKYPQSAGGTFTSTNHRLWKNNSGGYNNFTNVPVYRKWVVADNGSNDWTGATNNGGISSDHLGIGFSLNNAHTIPTWDGNDGRATITPRHAFVSYHGTVRFQNNSWFNYTYAPIFYWFNNDRGAGGGVMQGGTDFYDIGGIDRTTGLNDGNKFVSAHPGAMAPPVHFHPLGVDYSGTNQNLRYSVSCVWYDIDGKYGTAGKYMLPFTPATGVVDDYFLSGAAGIADGPTTDTAVCKTTTTKFQAIGQNDDGTWAVKWAGSPVNGNISSNNLGDQNPITVTRQDSSGVTIGTPFMVKRGDTGAFLGQYRQIPMQSGGRFQIDFSEKTAVTISNASPCVVTYPNSASHGLVAGSRVVFSTTSALPTGLAAGTVYYVLAAGLANSTFRVALSPGGSAINTSSAGSGTHSYTYALDTPDSLVLFDIYSPNPAADDFMLLGIPWANASTPRVCFGSNFSNESTANVGTLFSTRNTFASAADVTAGRAIICSSGASLAAALADTTGATFYRDTTNNRVWVRYTNRKSGGGALTARTMSFGTDVKTVVVKV